VKSVLYLQSELAYPLQYPQPSPKISFFEQVAIPVKSEVHPSFDVLQNSLKPDEHYP
jgi:ubiquitin-protein ligase